MRILCRLERMESSCLIVSKFKKLEKQGHLTEDCCADEAMCRSGRGTLENRIGLAPYRLSAVLEQCVFRIKKECFAGPLVRHAVSGLACQLLPAIVNHYYSVSFRPP